MFLQVSSAASPPPPHSYPSPAQHLLILLLPSTSSLPPPLRSGRGPCPPAAPLPPSPFSSVVAALVLHCGEAEAGAGGSSTGMARSGHVAALALILRPHCRPLPHPYRVLVPKLYFLVP